MECLPRLVYCVWDYLCIRGISILCALRRAWLVDRLKASPCALSHGESLHPSVYFHRVTDTFERILCGIRCSRRAIAILGESALIEVFGVYSTLQVSTCGKPVELVDRGRTLFSLDAVRCNGCLPTVRT